MIYYAIRNKKTDKFYCAPYELWKNALNKATLYNKEHAMETVGWLNEYHENELEIVVVELTIKGTVADEK